MSAEDKVAAVDIRDVVKRFGAVTALRRVSLDIRDNEFFTLLGPSGCGKTTLLRMIGGFETVTEGAIYLYGEEIEYLPANRRPVNTVFQNYALFPHMTVAENVAFGMRMQGAGVEDAAKRTDEMLALVQLTQFANRRPAQLSGGQQQRVALARALAPRPKVLLLDEPLSALDLKLRQSMRMELKQIQQETGIAFVFVTHDQEEALTMSDRIAVMSDGELQQVGDSTEIYEAPKNRFVSSFIGETNILDVTIESVDGAEAKCVLPGGASTICATSGPARPGAGHVSIRPERLTLTSADGEGIGCVIDRTVYLGTDTQFVVHLEGGIEINVRVQNAHGMSPNFSLGDRATLHIDPGAARLLVD